MMDKYEAMELIDKHLCKEIVQIAENLQKNQSMSIQDLEKLDKLYHTYKSKLTVDAMLEAEEYAESGMSGNYQNGSNSGRRGRAANGQYISRDTGLDQSYADGYNQGYSEAMSRSQGGNSGHYPMMPSYYGPRRW